MYRIKFIKLCSIQKKRVVEHGPWQPSMGNVEEWIDYFASLNYSLSLEVEQLVQGRAHHVRSVQL